MYFFIIIFISNFSFNILALDLGDGSDSECDETTISAGISAAQRVFNCTTLTIAGGGLTVPVGGGDSLIIKVQESVTISSIISLNGSVGIDVIGDNSDKVGGAGGIGAYKGGDYIASENDGGSGDAYNSLFEGKGATGGVPVFSNLSGCGGGGGAHGTAGESGDCGSNHGDNKLEGAGGQAQRIDLKRNLVGGAGGGGGSLGYEFIGYGGASGGGGGGAIKIEAREEINIEASGAIIAKGGNGGTGDTGNTSSNSGGGAGGGAGGTIYLVSGTSIIVEGTLDIDGGIGGTGYDSGDTVYGGSGGHGGSGIVRFDIPGADSSLVNLSGATITSTALIEYGNSDRTYWESSIVSSCGTINTDNNSTSGNFITSLLGIFLAFFLTRIIKTKNLFQS